MKPLSPRPATGRPESLARLADQYAERHKAMENYVWAWYTTFGILRRLGIHPFSLAGRLLNVGFVVLLFLGLPLLITAVTGQWDVAPVRIWAVVAVVFGILGVVIYQPFEEAIDTFLSLHRVMADEEGLRRLIAWDQRWFNIRAVIPAAGIFATLMLFLLFWGEKKALLTSMPAGTILVGAMLLYEVGEITYTVFMLGIESRILGAYDYELYRLSPIDSVALQRSIRGSNQIGVLVSLVATVFIVGFVILLPRDSRLIGEVALILLMMAYLATGFGVILPRLAMKRIVQAEKEREMTPLQRRLDYLSARLPDLTEQEYTEMIRLKETHDIIRDSSENVLPISTIGQLVSSLILPTVAFVAAVAGEVVLGGLFERFFP